MEQSPATVSCSDVGGSDAILLVVILAFIASMTVVPLISHRNLMVIFPGIYFALTVLFSKGQSRRNVLAISAILGVLLLWPSLADYYLPHKTQWRESAKYIAEERGCSEVSFFPPGATTHHRVYLPPPFALRPASLDGGREGNGSWQPADLAVALEQAMGTENECGVLLWVVPTNSVAKALAELELPGDIKIQQFFEAAVILHK